MEFLSNIALRAVIAKYLSGVEIDAIDDDGIFALQWRSTETFYRQTEEYVAPEKRAAYKHELERVFPNKKAVL